MSTDSPLVSDQIVDNMAKEALEIVESSDYTQCPVPGQEKVMKYLVVGLTALLHNARKNGSGNGSMKMLLIKSVATKTPWAAVALFAFWIVAKAQGWL
jgi:hypothetical protein